MCTIVIFRSYDQPCIPPERLCRNVDSLQVAFTTKLKAKSRNKLILDFEHDCFRYLFYGKGRQSRDDKYLLLEKHDFIRCKFVDNWDVAIDRIGDGVAIKYPVKVRAFLAKSPKSFSVANGTLQESQQMLIEKLSIDFARQPVTVSKVD